MGRYTEKPNRYRIFWKTDTDTDVGIWKTENTEKPTKKTGISEAAVALLHTHNCTLHNALKNDFPCLGIWLEFDYNDTSLSSLQSKQPALNNLPLVLPYFVLLSHLAWKSLRDISIIKLLSYEIQIISSITHTHSHTSSVLTFLALSSSQFNSRLKTVLHHS